MYISERLISILAGFIGFNEAKELGEEVFENIMRLLASGLIVYFIVWVGNQSKDISANIKNKVGSSTSAFGILVLSFLSVFREGMELCIMILTNITKNASNVALGIGIGLILAVTLTYIIFKSSIKFNLGLIFKILGVILIYLGAEMFAESILGFTELAEDPYEAIFIVLFAIPTLYFFFKNDVKKLLKKD